MRVGRAAEERWSGAGRPPVALPLGRYESRAPHCRSGARSDSRQLYLRVGAGGEGHRGYSQVPARLTAQRAASASARCCLLMAATPFKSVLQHRGVRLIGGGWVFFITENVVLSGNRDAIIASIGEVNYTRTYSALSTCACASIAYGYLRHGRQQGPKLWTTTPRAARYGAVVLQGLGLVGFSQMLPRLQVPITMDAGSASEVAARGGPPASDSSAASTVRVRCPMDFRAEGAPEDGIAGLKRVTRHPTFWSMGALGLGTALATPFATEAVMFGMPALMALVGTTHQDYRFRRNSGGELPTEVDAVTSNAPFLALITGKQSWGVLGGEIKWLNAAIALLGAGLLAVGRRGRGRR